MGIGDGERRKKKKGGRAGEGAEGESPQPLPLHPQSPLVFFVRSPPPSENLEQARIKYLKSMNSITTCGTLINNVDSADESVNEILKV